MRTRRVIKKTTKAVNNTNTAQYVNNTSSATYDCLRCGKTEINWRIPACPECLSWRPTSLEMSLEQVFTELQRCAQNEKIFITDLSIFDNLLREWSTKGCRQQCRTTRSSSKTSITKLIDDIQQTFYPNLFPRKELINLNFSRNSVLDCAKSAPQDTSDGPPVFENESICNDLANNSQDNNCLSSDEKTNSHPSPDSSKEIEDSPEESLNCDNAESNKDKTNDPSEEENNTAFLQVIVINDTSDESEGEIGSIETRQTRQNAKQPLSSNGTRTSQQTPDKTNEQNLFKRKPPGMINELRDHLKPGIDSAASTLGQQDSPPSQPGVKRTRLDSLTKNAVKYVQWDVLLDPRKLDRPIHFSNHTQIRKGTFRFVHCLLDQIHYDLNNRNNSTPMSETSFNCYNIDHIKEGVYSKAHIEESKSASKMLSDLLPATLQLKKSAQQKGLIFVNFEQHQCHAHYDRDSSLLYVISGNKEIYIKKPEVGKLGGMELNSYSTDNSTIFEHLDPFKQNTSDWSLVRLEKGDALLLPKYWLHVVRSSAGTIGISIQIEPSEASYLRNDYQQPKVSEKILNLDSTPTLNCSNMLYSPMTQAPSPQKEKPNTDRSPLVQSTLKTFLSPKDSHGAHGARQVIVLQVQRTSSKIVRSQSPSAVSEDEPLEVRTVEPGTLEEMYDRLLHKYLKLAASNVQITHCDKERGSIHKIEPSNSCLQNQTCELPNTQLDSDVKVKSEEITNKSVVKKIKKTKYKVKTRLKRRKLLCGKCGKENFGIEMWFLCHRTLLDTDFQSPSKSNFKKASNCEPRFAVPTDHKMHILCLICHPRSEMPHTSEYFKPGEIRHLENYRYVLGSVTDYDYAIEGSSLHNKMDKLKKMLMMSKKIKKQFTEEDDSTSPRSVGIGPVKVQSPGKAKSRKHIQL